MTTSTMSKFSMTFGKAKSFTSFLFEDTQSAFSSFIYFEAHFLHGTYSQ